MIVLGHNIGSSIDMDFVNIGILKAVGMTNASVKLALLAGYMCTVAAGLFLSLIHISSPPVCPDHARNE